MQKSRNLKAIKTGLPWWMKIGAKLILSRIPVSYSLWQKIGLFRHGYMDTAGYALGVFEGHILRAGLSVNNLKEKSIIELGPGDSLATALIASALGAKSILIDAGHYVSNDLRAYQTLETLLGKRGFLPPSTKAISSTNELLNNCEGKYLTAGLDSFQKIDSESVDFVFSQAVLEHVRKNEFFATQKECYRVMKPGALASHRIDLRDHLSQGLNNLRFSERVWESKLFSTSGFYTNRLGFPKMLEIFNSAGFVVEFTDVRKWEDLPTPRSKMSQEFRGLSETELCISGFDVLLRKPISE